MNKNNIEAIYRLSPMQQGMLFHALYTPESASGYFEWLDFPLDGNIDAASFRRAWQQVLDRHSILRTAFVWEREGEPLQIVRQQAAVPFQELDWRGLSAADQQKKLISFLHTSRQSCFDLSKAPLMQLTLIQLSENSYQFVWANHHLILDGWSRVLVINEVFAYYQAYRRGEPLNLPPPRPYRDYIAWLQGQDLTEAESFWRRTLRDFTAPTPLIHGRVLDELPAEQELFEKEKIQLTEEETSRLRAITRDHQLTLNTVVQGMWALLLSRYSRERDVVFGAVVSGRPAELEGVEQMVGLFINTLPVRVRVEEGRAVSQWLKQMQGEQVEARQYEYSPLVQVQGWSDVPRGIPLFESLVVFESYPIEASLREQGESNEIRSAGFIERTNYPLTLLAIPSSRLTLQLSYDCRRFDSITIKSMLQHLETLLQGIVADPERRVSEMGLLSEEERQRMLFAWNDTSREYPKDKCIHELFEEQTQRTPDALALVFADEQLSYRELNERANQLAYHLRSLGVMPDSLVGIALPRSVQMVVALLGILKAGGAYLPLDTAYPQERLTFMLDDAQAGVLITSEELLPLFAGQGREIFCLERDAEAISSQPTTNLSHSATAEHLAYVIYTSGSTGTPKGVAVTHSGLANLVSWHLHAYGVTEADRATQLASTSFDASAWEVWPYLLAGASLHLVGEEERAHPAKLLRWLATERISICFLPTPLAEAVLCEMQPEGLRLRFLLTGGDVLHAGAWGGLSFRLVNHYGPTECTVVATAREVLKTEVGTGGWVSIGEPIANTQVYVLDAWMGPVPVGVAGELYIGGDGLARGYLNRAELTAERFVPHPFGTEAGARLYRTGDLVRYLPEGNLEFIGRIDQQVKVRGFRIEPGEIEAVLRTNAGVNDCVVLAREDVPGDRRLVAYLVAENAGADIESLLAINEVRSYLKERLPGHMIPSAFMFLQTLPLTPGGKVDRRALPAPDGSRPEPEDTYVVPRTPVEEVLAEVWADVLRISRVGVHDNFFALGGDSILSIQITARANRRGLHLTPRQLFLHQTIAELALVAKSATASLADQSIVTGPVPLTPIQSWFFEQGFPDLHHFNQSVLLEAHHPLDAAALERAVQQLLRHHDALRLRFTRSGGQSSWQQFNADAELHHTFSRVDFSSMPDGEHAQAIANAAEELQRGLDISQGPLVRVVLFDLGALKANRLLIIVHHLAVDGVSWRILLEDLQRAYRQALSGQAIDLGAKTTSFKQWAEGLSEYARSSELRQERAYWREVASQSSARLPLDDANGDRRISSAQTLTLWLSEEETRQLLQDVPAVYRTQINDVLLTALAQAFYGWTGERALVIEMEGHGREEVVRDADVSRTVGWFTSMYPVRLELEEGAESGGLALQSIKEQLRRVPQRGVGYGLLRYLSGDEEMREELKSEAEVSFNYLGQFDQVLGEEGEWGAGRESTGEVKSEAAMRGHVLEINGSVAGGRLQMSWTYSEGLHRRETVEGLGRRYMEALRGSIEHCRRPEAGGFSPSDFPLAKLDQQKLASLSLLLGENDESELVKIP